MSFENDTKEYFDSTEEFSEKINDFVNLIKTSKHIICFTGAGISTFAGIPDYRSTKETVLPTGAGVHTRDQSSKKEEFKPNLLPKPSLTYFHNIQFFILVIWQLEHYNKKILLKLLLVKILMDCI